MRIGIVTTWFDRGASFVSKQFMDELAKDNNDIFIYARGGEHFAKGNPSWDLPSVTWNTFSDSFVPTDINIFQYIKWIKRNNIEIIIFNEQQFWMPVVITKLLKVKTVAYIDYYTTKTYKFFEIYDQLWCNTKRHFDVFKRFNNAKYIKWGTNIDKFLPIENNNSKIKLYHSAGMNPHRKGTDILIQALNKLDDYQLNKFEILIHSQTKIDNDLSILINKLNINFEVGTFDAPKYLGWADIYVYPSRLDGIGLTIAESIAAGCFIITTNEPPMNEFVEDAFGKLIEVESYKRRRDGYYWKECEPSAHSLSKILKSLEKEQIYNSKAFARKYAENNLDFSKNMQKANGYLLALEQNKTSPRIILMIIIYDFKNLLMANFIFRFLNYVLKKIYRKIK